MSGHPFVQRFGPQAAAASRRSMFLVVAIAAVCAGSTASAQYTLTTLATFNGTNGAIPHATLIADASGNLYGTTAYGGDLTVNSGLVNGGIQGGGTVFEVANDANHTLSTLATFNGTNGQTPLAGVIADASGNLYGTTAFGGANGNGTVFEVANNANHTLTTLATFNLSNGGDDPQAGLLADASGNLYGTTAYGGGYGRGTVFKVANDANHTLSTLLSFDFRSEGPYQPRAGLIADASGNLYGTTYVGGADGNGTVFELFASSSYTRGAILANVVFPSAGLLADASGNLYGTCAAGVFEVANDANHTFSTIATLNGNSYAGLIADASGNLYGTTSDTVFEVANDSNHTLTILATNLGSYAGLLADASGNLYGTSIGGANGYGTVFELTPVPEPSALALGLLALGALGLKFHRRKTK